MLIKEIIEGLKRHREFIFFNTLIHFFAGIFIASAIYPFLNNRLRATYNYFIVVFFPAIFGSIFPDLIFISSVISEHRMIDGLFIKLSSGGEVYSVFHFGLPIILVVPTTVFCVLIINKIFRQKFDQLPPWSLLIISLISLFAALFHILLDSVGF